MVLEECDHCGLERDDTIYTNCSDDVGYRFDWIRNIKYCPLCGKKLPTFEDKKRNRAKQVMGNHLGE